ncbi:hypothetical protein [Natronosalvus caseinilyticus]|uniref:hypothetical protein n=1 Tax=Natronosalvus caseinilyticus TaxID=2953747 RepID=UPI0028AD2497|nr:hypothetical protein [Natronosalvus caseinilyticus]
MERVQAALGGLVVVVALYGGYVLVRTLTRALYAIVWFTETVAMFAFALLIGYVAYRVLWGVSDDPRRH